MPTHFLRLAACVGTLSVAVAVIAQVKPANAPNAAGNPPAQPLHVPQPAAVMLEPTVGKLGLRIGELDTANLPNLIQPARMVAAFDPNTHYVVQLSGPITPQQRNTLSQLGVQLQDYLPTYAYIAVLAEVNPQQLAALDFLMWVGEYQNAWKIDAEINSQQFATAERQAIAAQGDVVLDLTLFHNITIDQALPTIAAVNNGVGVTIHHAHTIRPHIAENAADMAGMGGAITVTVPFNNGQTLQQLAANPFIQYIQEHGEVTLRNSSNRWIVQSNVLNVTPLYNAGLHGENQIVGVMDGKINVNHCSFRDTTQPTPNSTPNPNHRKIIAYNATTGYDLHGTHVAGTAAGDAGASDNNRGVAYLSKLVYAPIPSLSENSVFNALTLHHTQGARLHTNSWGNDFTTAYDGLCRGIDNFSYLNEDSLVLLAVTNTSTLKNPENAKNLLAVGATQDANSQGNHCSGGTGPTSDSRRKPEIYAPGCNTTSSSGSGASACNTTNLTGTSMATPAVTGAGALVRQYYTAGYYPTGSAVPGNGFTPTGALVKATLLNAAVDMTGVSGYPSNQEGWGRVLADEALSFAGETRKLLAYDVRNNAGAGTLSTGSVVNRVINVTSAAQKLKVTLVWTEPPASSGASFASINDLDLEVVGPSGTYLGNWFSSGQSATGGTRDIRNNVEQVHLNSPATGSWTVRVKGAAVNQGVQGYALVVSGAVATSAGPPANDFCSSATVANIGSQPFTTVSATTDGPSEPGLCNFGGFTHVLNDVWFTHVADCNGITTVSLCGANYNSKIAIYGSACPGSSGAVLACNDDSCGTASEVSFASTQGQTYRIRIGSFNGSTGSGNMLISCTPTSPCPPDTNGDQQVDVTDLLAVINAWGVCPAPCPADTNTDGQVDVTDLLAIINGWGPC